MPLLLSEHPAQPITTCAFAICCEDCFGPNPAAIQDGTGIHAGRFASAHVAVTLNEPGIPLGATLTLT